VRQIINDVRRRGDKALFELTEKFDGAKLTALEVNKSQIKAAYKKVDPKLVDAMKLAAERIGTFHQAQKERALPTYTTGKPAGWSDHWSGSAFMLRAALQAILRRY